MKRKLAALLLAAVALIGTAATVIVNADFKGEWSFNEGKSKMGEGRMRMNATTLKVSNDGAAIVIERTSSFNGESRTSSEKITTDGKPSENTVFGNSKKVSTAAWSASGEELTINATTNFERDGNTIEIKSVEIWKLLDGGKTLSIDATTTTPRGENKTTLVYDKK
ncbi:hypothetical protein [Paraflavitalea pollutisoli]|uniref:hypothetical protein n=1 Tax=Paraflavitalea pollutisoli TaxID=3034143 RepID=UPI0023EDD9FD|nr:hypothetical protein [Paraflavitalea sp. H1-2-19X]